MGIEAPLYDDRMNALDHAIDLVNEGKEILVCHDPWWNDDANYGHGDTALLFVPVELAEKILVLGKLP